MNDHGAEIDADTNSLIDPRGPARVTPAAPAARLTTLAEGRVLLVDNGKLAPSYGNYAVIHECLRESEQGATWPIVSMDLLRNKEDDMPAIAAALIAEHAPDACVLALSDAGVTIVTAMLAVEMERRGVPCAMLATPLGAGLAQVIFQAHLPGVACITMDTVRTDDTACIRALMERHMGEIRAALTRQPAVVAETAVSLFGGDTAPWVAADDAMATFQDFVDSTGIGDGLPVLPPTRRAIDRLLAAVAEDPDDVLYGPAITSGRVLRVRDAAANAAMTACPPNAFPVVLAALRAMARPEYRLFQAVITTHPGGNVIILAGADPARYGMSGGAGCLGPGHRGNASIGRAVSLSVQNLFGVRPGHGDLTAFGSPVEFTCCCAETVDANPWPSLASEHGGGAGVLVLKAEAPQNAMEHLATTPMGLCETFAAVAAKPGSNNAYVSGDLMLLLNPEHAGIFAAAGWSRKDVARAMHHLATNPRHRLNGRGIVPIRPRYMDDLDPVPVTRSPEDVHIVVAGAPGPQSMVVVPWGYSRGQWQSLGA